MEKELSSIAYIPATDSTRVYFEDGSFEAFPGNVVEQKAKEFGAEIPETEEEVLEVQEEAPSEEAPNPSEEAVPQAAPEVELTQSTTQGVVDTTLSTSNGTAIPGDENVSNTTI